ncbi:MAG: DegT/DnrJ/EryC1/StrS family aminotransferase [Candidatus Omnitrophica bacterium]|nr:DegT/DnrJ/EryC1/StrS family aminotransferase [Candidatus Omnitrophota bacterium]
MRGIVHSSSFLKPMESQIGKGAIPVSCARAGLVAGLRALGIKRMDEILVAPYMCQAVLSALSRTAFPTMTPSHRTKAIMVFHQFGFPQNLSLIEDVAKKNKWIIVSDCAHTISSSYKGQNVVRWGDFSVVSFSKIFPCILGGALVSSREKFLKEVENKIKFLSPRDKVWVEKAYRTLEKYQKIQCGNDAVFEIASVYGYLPEVVSFPQQAESLLPKTKEEVVADIERRRNIWKAVKSFFPKLVPICLESDVVPWAIPIKVDPAKAENIVQNIKKKVNVDLPILHFDFARNMLNPDYRKALVIDCHNETKEGLVGEICTILKKEVLKG